MEIWWQFPRGKACAAMIHHAHQRRSCQNAVFYRRALSPRFSEFRRFTSREVLSGSNEGRI